MVPQLRSQSSEPLNVLVQYASGSALLAASLETILTSLRRGCRLTDGQSG
jgi:hypothetical protein